MSAVAFEPIVALLQTYFDGLYHSDAARLRQVFHPEAIYACATEGRLKHLRMPEYFEVVARRPSPASRNELRRDRIAGIEFAGPVTALARVQCAIGPKRFTDLLTLVRLDGRWQIISKVFHFELADD
ncbi:MAG: nuclear transport factor 2 family protein [Burkholderiaceae bacterium]|nr:nuclear transport factor 2 family protein [Burkholderiaceae bacterium]